MKRECTVFLRCGLAWLCATWWLVGSLPAQDRVVIQPRGRFSGRTTVRGEIVEYTGKVLRIRVSSTNAEREYAADDVVEVETTHGPAYERAQKLLEEHRAAEALQAWSLAVDQEERPWVRRDILRQAVGCALSAGDRAAAGTRFLALVKSDPDTPHFGAIPLVWAPETLSPAVRDAARVWLALPGDVAPLLGASLLLEDRDYADKASQTLTALATSSHPRVRVLAQAQAWRLRLQMPELSRLEINRWQSRIDDMPAELRGGPYFVLGRAYRARQEHELAAAAFLHLPFADHPDRPLAARAELEAAEGLLLIGQVAEAHRLLAEIVARYPETPSAGVAQSRLQMPHAAGALLQPLPAPSRDEARPAAGEQEAVSLSGCQTEMEPTQNSESVPPSRLDLFPRLLPHCERLAAQRGQIAAQHAEAADKLAAWIAAHYKPGERLAVLVVCTGNSRRSMLGAVWGNIAAQYVGLPEVRFFSAGTEPSAFNARTVATLQALGCEIVPTGAEAQRGGAGAPNPIYTVRWGSSAKYGQIQEFSKRYTDPTLPKRGFAALLVCAEADAACPSVPGASLRLSLPFDDPKTYDGTPQEGAKYAERRDDIGRVMLRALQQARQRLHAPGQTP